MTIKIVTDLTCDLPENVISRFRDHGSSTFYQSIR